MSLKPNSIRLSLLSLLLLLNLTLFSQIRIASPYSRFGIGDISDNNNAWNMSMGQTGYAFRSPYHINFLNPASYTAFDSTSFVFEGGFNADVVQLTSSLQTVNRNYASLGYLLFGFPITKWWRTSIGLVPYSDVGYTVVNYEVYPDIGSVVRVYSGSGGTNRLFWGNAFRITKNLSIGMNATYIFGSMLRESLVTFPDSVNSMSFKVDNYVILNDLYLNFGAQYRARLKKNLFLSVGAVYANTSNMNAKLDVISQTFLLGSNGVEYPKDTLGIALGYRGTVTIPTMFGGGIALEHPDRWMAGVDFRWQNWEKFRAFDMSDSLVNSWQINAGAEIVPNPENYSNYLARIRYRVGFLYNQTYLKLRGQSLNEYAFSIGFGLPLRGVKTALNLGMQVGTRGTTQANLIKETYFKFVIGFSIYERWFVKRKYY
ncbi:MAG: hypothetical protein WCO93_01225 [bacterium]